MHLHDLIEQTKEQSMKASATASRRFVDPGQKRRSWLTKPELAQYVLVDERIGGNWDLNNERPTGGSIMQESSTHLQPSWASCCSSPRLATAPSPRSTDCNEQEVSEHERRTCKIGQGAFCGRTQTDVLNGKCDEDAQLQTPVVWNCDTVKSTDRDPHSPQMLVALQQHVHVLLERVFVQGGAEPGAASPGVRRDVVEEQEALRLVTRQMLPHRVPKRCSVQSTSDQCV